MKSYVSYRMTQLPVTFTDLETHFSFLKHFQIPYFGNVAHSLSAKVFYRRVYAVYNYKSHAININW